MREAYLKKAKDELKKYEQCLMKRKWLVGNQVILKFFIWIKYKYKVKAILQTLPIFKIF